MAADLTVKIFDGSKLIAEKTVENSQSACFEFIGQTFKEVAERGDIPCNLRVDTTEGDALYQLTQRGTFYKDENHTKMPSLFVVENYCHICTRDENPDYKDKYLTCVNFGSNNHKFYWLRPGPYGIDATYGRIGVARGEMFGEKDLAEPFPNRLYWVRYYEKLSKGYVDSTEIYLAEDTLDAKDINATSDDAPKTAVSDNAGMDAPSLALFRKLRAASAQYVGARVAVTKNLTKTHYDASVQAWNELSEIANNGCTIEQFNTALKKLLMIVPRKVSDVNDIKAHDAKDFAEILDREHTLINAMFCMFADHVNLKTEDGFGAHNIKVYVATDKQKEEVLKKLPPNLASSVKEIYRVIPAEQKAKFNKYLEDNHIKKVKQFWHGSRTENWYSIILNSLSLNPNARITGKMFGQGIYFAPSAQKSWGYTSGLGSYWAHGTDKTSYMGLFATAYGHPLDVDTALGSYFTKRDLKAKGKDCVFAHAGRCLRNDEVVFYDEDAVLLNYLVEFEK